MFLKINLQMGMDLPPALAVARPFDMAILLAYIELRLVIA